MISSASFSPRYVIFCFPAYKRKGEGGEKDGGKEGKREGEGGRRRETREELKG